jgi:hypothetical protein
VIARSILRRQQRGDVPTGRAGTIAGEREGGRGLVIGQVADDDEVLGRERKVKVLQRAAEAAEQLPGMTPPSSLCRNTHVVAGWILDAQGQMSGYLGKVRNRFITHQPAFMLGVIPGLVRPDFLIEIEVVAAVLAGEDNRPR